MPARAHNPLPSSGTPGGPAVLCVLLVLLTACDGGVDEDVAPPIPEDESGWSTLIEADWTLEPGSEGFVCALHTVETDLYIRTFRADAPPGTHHTLLTVTEPKGPDEVFECGPGTLSDAMIFASGIGTDDLTLPEGVAIRVPAGKQLLLNLHLLNPTPSPMSGTSGTLIQTLPAEAVDAEAEVVFAGTTDFSLPPGEDTSATGSCVFEEDATLLSLWPHMHQHGRHMVVEHVGPEGMSTLHDAPFDFNHQVNTQLEPTMVRAGERIDVTCQWSNPGSETVLYGDSSTQEMCFAGMVRYPATSRSLYCDMPFF